MKYVAFIRAIGPTDGNDRLRRAFEEAGFKNVSSLLSSGNVLFESEEKNGQRLETLAEKALEAELGRHKAVFVRSQKELMVNTERRPFGDMEHSPRTNLNLTFLRKPKGAPWKMPHKGEGYTILDIHGRTVFSVVDTLNSHGPELMRQLEKAYGSENTTRTLLTVQRVLKRMEVSHGK